MSHRVGCSPGKKTTKSSELDIRCQVIRSNSLQCLLRRAPVVVTGCIHCYLFGCNVEPFNLDSLYTLDKKSSIFFFRISFTSIDPIRNLPFRFDNGRLFIPNKRFSEYFEDLLVDIYRVDRRRCMFEMGKKMF